MEQNNLFIGIADAIDNKKALMVSENKNNAKWFHKQFKLSSGVCLSPSLPLIPPLPSTPL